MLGGYVLSALEPDEMEAVRAHLGACPECSREHAALAPLPSLLDVAGSADATAPRPSAALEDAVLDRFARERRRLGEEPPAPPSSAARRARERARGWLSRPVPVAAGAAAAAVAATIAVTGAVGGSAPTAHAFDASLRGSALSPGARADARLSSQSAGTRVDLRVRGMQPTPGAVYELWCVADNGTRVSAGTFRVDGSGRATVRLTTAARLGQYDRLSVERVGPGRPAGPVMTGSIAY